MSSIFTYNPDPPRVYSPWSIGSSTSQVNLPDLEDGLSTPATRDMPPMDVASKGQLIFDALSQNLPTHWDEENIVVADVVSVSPPYHMEDCLLLKEIPLPEGNAFDQVRSLVDMENKKIGLRDDNAAIDVIDLFSHEAQDIFDALRQTMPTCWDGQNIVVPDGVFIASPYTVNQCRSSAKGNAASLAKVRSVIAKIKSRNLRPGAVPNEKSLEVSKTPIRAFLSDFNITKLEPEPQDGPIEYKVHLLIGSRRRYLRTSTSSSVGREGHTSDSVSSHAMQYKSPQSRKERMHGLTTQMLWRLQQSSPFHSATSNVGPAFAETLPWTGALYDWDSKQAGSHKPIRLLPGLEDSKGALYEIGVADDGEFIGLTMDEMDESLINLEVMATSLGCKVEVLRWVVVGDCEWTAYSWQNITHESLWVVEALVSPDLNFYKLSPGQASMRLVGSSDDPISYTEQIRISIVGPSTAGKSSLIGTLNTSFLDNGRGKSRISLLKHQHEISSGVTSSISQELVGYDDGVPSSVINVASEDINSWNDIHATSQGGRLAFMSDVPGSIRYLKSTMRGLVGWAPHYVIICIPAICGEDVAGSTDDIDFCLAYLKLCLKLELSVLIVVTKFDVASRRLLGENLQKIYNFLKAAGRKHQVLSAPSPAKNLFNSQLIVDSDSKEVKSFITASKENPHLVPIILSSSVDGTAIGKIHAFIRYMPIPSLKRLPGSRTEYPRSPKNLFDVEEIFDISPSKVFSLPNEKKQECRGLVLCGLVRHGNISIGDEMLLGPILVDDDPSLGVSSNSGSPSGRFSASLTRGLSLPGKDCLALRAKWQKVRVVSVRALRLPVCRLLESQVGTVGVEFFSSPEDCESPNASRIRKGMVLMNVRNPTFSKLTSTPPFHIGFSATFSAAQFSDSNSPPLLLGSDVIAYIISIRAIVRVVSMEPVTGLEEPLSAGTKPDTTTDKPLGDVHISFTFVNSVEWVELGSQVLIMPGFQSGSTLSLTTIPPEVAISGLEGFVGSVCDVVSRKC
ncbi:hypothetical protein N7495_004216 [Penicillium taxi]|uniref:uncharacterized protein n=1 Tax=Penicillium taxi TaxID=168475 RepID=UPI002545B718|nr:uncharacterized protein N7495_004216 [Penicillium taxi]KAJ5899472.1 hypothetical protein N7495_004216 [Penicillium taxi]